MCAIVSLAMLSGLSLPLQLRSLTAWSFDEMRAFKKITLSAYHLWSLPSTLMSMLADYKDSSCCPPLLQPHTDIHAERTHGRIRLC